MDKMQVEEMRDFFSQKITYEVISAIYPSVRRYSIKSTKRFFIKKIEYLPRSFKTMCKQ